MKPVPPVKVDPRLIIAHVARYVWSFKTIFNDPEAQFYLMNFVYNCTPSATSAEAKYKEYYNANNPIIIGEKETVGVAVNSVLPLSPDTWQAEWTEERFTINGGKVSTKHYRGIFTTAITTPSAMQEVLTNPLGIFITDFNFSEVM